MNNVHTIFWAVQRVLLYPLLKRAMMSVIRICVVEKGGDGMNDQWIQAWGMAHAGLSLFCFRGRNRTFRLTIHSSISGKSIRLTLSNRFSRQVVEIDAAYAALCSADGAVLGERAPVLFGGQSAVTLNAGETCRSDALAMTVPAGYHFCVSIHVKKGKLLSGNALDDAKLTFCRGNHAADASFPHRGRPKDRLLHLAEKVMGMYLSQPIPLFESVELLNGEGASSIVCFGDSITQQGRWIRPFDRRIQERFPGRYAVINRSVTGNRILRDAYAHHPLKNFFGKRALERFAWDVRPFSGIKYVIVCLGTNDYIQPGTIDAPRSDRVTAQEVAQGLKELACSIHELGASAYGATLIPFGGSSQCNPKKDAVRVAVNQWLKTSSPFDRVADFDAAFAREEEPYLAKEGYTGKDGGHPSPIGGEALAQSIPLEWFV